VIKKILFIFLFILVCSFIFADKMDDSAKDVSSFKKTKVILEGKEYLIYHKFFGQKIAPNGEKLVCLIFKDEIIKDYKSYLSVIYAVERKTVLRLGFIENIYEKIKDKEKSILFKLFENDDFEKVGIMVEQVKQKK